MVGRVQQTWQLIPGWQLVQSFLQREECFMQEPHSCPIKLIIQQVEKWIFFLNLFNLISWTCTSLAELSNIALTHKVIISKFIQPKTYGLIYNSLTSKLMQPKWKNDIISKVSFFHKKKINQMRKNEVILSKMICNITSIHSFLFQNHLTHT